MKRKNQNKTQNQGIPDLPTSKAELVDMVMDSKLTVIYQALSKPESKKFMAAHPDITLREMFCNDNLLNIFQKLNEAVSKAIEVKSK